MLLADYKVLINIMKNAATEADIRNLLTVRSFFCNTSPGWCDEYVVQGNIILGPVRKTSW